MNEKHHKRIARALIFAVFVAGFAFALIPLARSADSAGEVTSLRNGKLFRWEKAQWNSIERGAAVKMGDKLKTDDKALAIVNFPDNGRFVIGPKSELTIGDKSGAFSTELPRGQIWVDASSLPKGRLLQVGTPQAVAGVRGTKFSVIADEIGTAGCTCEGLIEVSVLDQKSPGDTAPAVISSAAKQFVEIDTAGNHPGEAKSDLHLLRRKRGDRYDFCFTCHEVGGRGKMKKDWSDL